MIARGSVKVPGDKSITHRALFVAAMATGRSELRGALAALDTRATASCLRAFGVAVSPLAGGRRVGVEGRGLRPFRPAGRRVNCANSGTTARLAMGVLAAHGFKAALTGDRSLRARPMERVAAPLREMGARITTTDGRLPVTVNGGPLRSLEYRSPVASAQVKTALLLAGLAGGVSVSVAEPVTSRDHTERLLRLLGAPVSVNGRTVSVSPAAALPAFEGEVPGDFSSAAYLLAAGVLARRGELAVRDVGTNPTRTGFLRALERMGARIELTAPRESLGEPLATMVARPAPLTAVEVAPEEIPSMVDEIPLLACLAARARGTSVFRGVGELRVKESDRLALVARNLTALGAGARVEKDTLWVEGGARPPRGRVVTEGDHRLVMAFAVLGTVYRSDVRLDSRRAVSVSYPAFFRDLARVLG